MSFIKTNFPNVFYFESKNKNYLGKPDRSFIIRYRAGKKRKAETVGWRSAGMNATQTSNILNEITGNIKLGKRPQSVKEMRTISDEKKKAETERKKLNDLENITFHQLMEERYLPWSKKNKKSWQHDHQRYHKHLKNPLGKLKIKNISPKTIEDLKQTLSDKDLAPATVKQCLVLVRQAFYKAIKIWNIFSESNPVLNELLPTIDNSRTRYLKETEITQLLNLLKQQSPIIHDMALVSLYTGLRFGEIAKLTVNDLNLEVGTIDVKDSKGGSRQAYMNEMIMVFFNNLSLRKPTGLIFPNSSGTTMTRIPEIFRECVNKLELNNNIVDSKDMVVFHTLRHTFASRLAIKGVPLYTIQTLMGHKTIEMTQRYAHLCPDHKRTAINILTSDFLDPIKSNLDDN